jgi:uncharacterized protein (DUF1015 family)
VGLPATRTAIEPLRALRYDPRRVKLADVVAPPYDVISAAERDALARRSPYSAVRLILPDSPDQAAGLLGDWRRQGVLRRDAEPALWWHEQRFVGPDGRERTRGGVLGALRLSAYEEGRVRPHEHTHAEVKQGRLELLRATRVNLSPIFVLYDDPADAAAAVAAAVTAEPPAMEVGDRHLQHRFWELRDPALVGAAQEALGDRELLIADGHHRYETALAYRAERRRSDAGGGEAPYDFMLAFAANLRSPDLAIFPTHRVVVGDAQLDERLLEPFDVTRLPAGTGARAAEAALAAAPPDRPAFAFWRGASQPALLVVLRDADAAARALPTEPPPVRRIDSAVLEALVLGPLLGVTREQFQRSHAVRYVRELDRAAAMVESGEASTAILLRAPSVDQVRDVAAAGGVMPQKSTYFFPKLYSGFLFNPLDD